MSEEFQPNETPEDDAAGTPTLAGPGRGESASPGRELAPRFTEGGQPGPGRPKGSLNRTTIVMRDAIAAVFEDLQAQTKGKGSYPHFLNWAKKHPSEFYRIAARQMPVPLEDVGRAVGLVVFRGLND